MIGDDELNETQATLLCKSCGLCCTGHLFIWAKLKPSELDPAEKLGMTVFRSDPNQRGFSQPCPLWKTQCTIYTTPNYPRACRAYQCKLLKELLATNSSLAQSLAVVEQARELIQGMESMLPVSPSINFRERLVEHIEHPQATALHEIAYQKFRLKADELLFFYEKNFGVIDLID